MDFRSILFNNISDRATPEQAGATECFVDLNLDQVVDAITARYKEYNLRPFYYNPLHDEDAVVYRQEVVRDLETEPLLAAVKAFSDQLIIVRRYLQMISKLSYPYHQKGWFLETCLSYCAAVSKLADDLHECKLSSRGFIGFSEYIQRYVHSHSFLSLVAESQSLYAKIKAIRYCVIIKGNWVRVRRYEEEIDYSQEVEKTFEKFKQGDVKSYRLDLVVAAGMNHVGAQILEYVAKLFPEVFKELDAFCEKFASFFDPTIRDFDREVQFYTSYLEYISAIKEKGLSFCFPKVSAQSKEVRVRDSFDVALAYKRTLGKASVIANDFFLEGPERILVVSGPNQGGKTTFARMFGQLHYLSSLGLPVPGTEAQLFLFGDIFTHFEKEEDIRNLRGKLQDDLVRIRHILDRASPNSIIIMNEIFTSTALKDAVFLSKRIMARIEALDCLSVCVSFIDELSTLSEKTVSMVSTVVPEQPEQRTYKILRKPADGLSYAICIAEKHRLTYDLIKERIKS